MLGVSVNANSASSSVEGKKSLSQFAQEQDDIDSGKSKWSDMGNWVDTSSMMVKSQPTKMDDLDKENISIKSLHEAVHNAEEEMKEKKDSNEPHEKKLQDKTFIETAIESKTVKP